MSLLGFGTTPVYAECSKSGCRAEAKWAVHWRNPRIHAEDRVKTWAACEEHRDELHDFVQARDFPVSITPFAIEIETLN